MNIFLEFGYSTSSRYGHAVALAAQQSGYTAEGEHRAVIHRLPVALPASTTIWDVFEIVGNWASSRLVINGHNLLTKNNTYAVCDCYRRRQAALDQAAFCYGRDGLIYNYETDNPWGCNCFAARCSQNWRSLYDREGEYIFKPNLDRIIRDMDLFEQTTPVFICPAYDLRRLRSAQPPDIDETPPPPIDISSLFPILPPADEHYLNAMARSEFIARQNAAAHPALARIAKMLGEYLVEARRCPRCGAVIDDDENLCLSCEGAKFQVEIEQEKLLVASIKSKIVNDDTLTEAKNKLIEKLKGIKA